MSNGYVFTCVCHSVNSGGDIKCIMGERSSWDRSHGHMGGVGVWHRGSVPQEGRPPPPPEVDPSPTPTQPPGGREPANTVSAREVRILLECILVVASDCTIFNRQVMRSAWRAKVYCNQWCSWTGGYIIPFLSVTGIPDHDLLLELKMPRSQNERSYQTPDNNAETWLWPWYHISFAVYLWFHFNLPV